MEFPGLLHFEMQVPGVSIPNLAVCCLFVSIAMIFALFVIFRGVRFWLPMKNRLADGLCSCGKSRPKGLIQISLQNSGPPEIMKRWFFPFLKGNPISGQSVPIPWSAWLRKVKSI